MHEYLNNSRDILKMYVKNDLLAKLELLKTISYDFAVPNQLGVIWLSFGGLSHYVLELEIRLLGIVISSEYAR